MTLTSAKREAKREGWRKLIEEQSGSGLSIVKFCRLRGVSKQAFYSWRKKLAGCEKRSVREREPARQTPTFAQVAVLPNGLAAANNDSSNGGNSPPLTIRLPNDVRIEVPRDVDRRTLREVLAALRSWSRREASC
jgi:hypothetical protein